MFLAQVLRFDDSCAVWKFAESRGLCRRRCPGGWVFLDNHKITTCWRRTPVDVLRRVVVVAMSVAVILLAMSEKRVHGRVHDLSPEIMELAAVGRFESCFAFSLSLSLSELTDVDADYGLLCTGCLARVNVMTSIKFFSLLTSSTRFCIHAPSESQPPTMVGIPSCATVSTSSDILHSCEPV